MKIPIGEIELKEGDKFKYIGITFVVIQVIGKTDKTVVIEAKGLKTKKRPFDMIEVLKIRLTTKVEKISE
jgi:hypothetical protein